MGMTISLAFWVLMLIWLAGTWWRSPVAWPASMPDLLLFILLVLLGWRVFGAPIHG